VPFGHGIQGPELIEGKKATPFQWITFTYQFNMTGQSAATVPAGFTKDGLPIVGRHLDDATALRAAAAYEAATLRRRTNGRPCWRRWDRSALEAFPRGAARCCATGCSA
jgi:Asp-tRNA(Asn)/Glu-tRNA(Gln) amidotransferase A subunit family amidase